MYQRRRLRRVAGRNRPTATRVGRWVAWRYTCQRDADRAQVGTMALNGRILIVEDDAHPCAKCSRSTSARTATRSRRRTSGTAMREAVEKTLPDVVLLDVNLPGEDGFTLARFLRERYDVGIIMVTGCRRRRGPRCRT